MPPIASHARNFGLLAVAFALASPAHAAIPLNLSSVDTQSTAYTRLKASVDRAVAGNPEYGFSGVDAVYMYRISGQSQYCDLAVATAERQVSKAEQRIAAGTFPEVAGDSFLYVGPMIAEVAYAYDICASFTTGSQRARWSHYANQVIWNVWNFREANWDGRPHNWSGWAIDNPGNNYHFSFLTATTLWALAKDQGSGGTPDPVIFAHGFENVAGTSATAPPDQTDWVQFLRTKKVPPLSAYYASLAGGASREGTNYGISQRELFAWYPLWRAASGQDLGNSTPHMTDTIHYWVHATLPDMKRFVPIGDQVLNSGHNIYDYLRHLMLEASAGTNNSSARQLGMWWLQNTIMDGTTQPLNQMRQSFNFRHDLLPSNGTARVPDKLMYRSEGTGHMFARTSWDPSAMWVSFFAGLFDESHAAQDQGAFSLYGKGDWLTVTSNIHSTRSGIVQSTAVNNVVRFERGGQIIPQVRYKTAGFTLNSSGAEGSFDATADVTPLYNGAISSWKRNLKFAQRKLTVSDTYNADSNTLAIFQVNTTAQPTVNGRVASAGRLNVKVISPANAEIRVVDMRTQTHLNANGFNTGWRIDVRAPANGAGEFKVELSEN